MSSAAEQIKMVAEELIKRETPADKIPGLIATMLNYNVADILIMLKALGLLEKMKVVNGVVNATSSSQVQVGETAEEIYKKNQAAVALRLVNIALGESNQIGAAVKAAIYVQEEATGRNEARAKKTALTDLLNLGQQLLHLKQTRDSIAESAQTGVIPIEATVKD